MALWTYAWSPSHIERATEFSFQVGSQTCQNQLNFFIQFCQKFQKNFFCEDFFQNCLPNFRLFSDWSTGRPSPRLPNRLASSSRAHFFLQISNGRCLLLRVPCILPCQWPLTTPIAANHVRAKRDSGTQATLRTVFHGPGIFAFAQKRCQRLTHNMVSYCQIQSLVAVYNVFLSRLGSSCS